MLRSASHIQGYAIGASDGPIGALHDLLIDDQSWRVRWLVVDTGHVLPGRKVLLPPSILGHVNHFEHQLAVRLTIDQVKNSPDIDTDAPVSRQMEHSIYDYYGWSPYWSTGFYMGPYAYPGVVMGAPFAPHTMGRDSDNGTSDANGGKPAGDPHLRSVREMSGYHIHALDGDIGHVADTLVEDGDWSVRYLVAYTQNWWPGKKVLLSPAWVRGVDWTERSVDVDVHRETIKESPEYDPAGTIDRAYEHSLHQHYGRPSVREAAE
jgi:hypothetical protein